MSARLDLRDVSAGYGASTVLRDVTFAAEPGQRVAILGPNGGGKTTLFRVLTDELPARTGTVTRDGAIAIVPQTERTRLDFPVSALDVVLMGTISTRPWWRGTRRADRERARRALGRVGLADRAGDRFGTLSGGQRQRVLVARALVRDASILLLDEPFAGLDATSADELERLFGTLAAEGRILLIATHDVAQAKRWDRVLCLRGRQVAHGVPGAVLDGPTIVATYGDGVLRLPDQDGLVVLADHHDHHHA